MTQMIRSLQNRITLDPATVFAIAAIFAGFGLGAAVTQVDSILLLGALVGGALILVAMLWIPEAGLLALVFITYVRLSDILIEYHGAPSIAKWFVPVLLGVVLLRWFLFGERPGDWLHVAILLGIYGLIITGSVFYARDPDLVVEGLSDYAKDALIAVLIVMLLRSGPTLRRVVWVLLLAGISLGTLTTIQGITGNFENTFGGFAGASVRNIVGEVNDFRADGPVSSNYYALILVVLVPLAMDRFWRERSFALRVLAGWALAVCGFSILLTFSRGGFLALMFVIVLMLFLHPPRPLAIAATLFVVVLLIPFIPPQYVHRLGTLVNILPTESGQVLLEENALRGRLSEITVAGLVFADHPLIGVGYQNFELYYLDYSPELGLDPRREDRAAHNLYLEIAAETGIIGLGAFISILALAGHGLWRSHQVFKRLGLQDITAMTTALAVGVSGFLFGSLFLHASYPRYFWLLIGICLALPSVAYNEVLRTGNVKSR